MYVHHSSQVSASLKALSNQDLCRVDVVLHAKFQPQRSYSVATYSRATPTHSHLYYIDSAKLRLNGITFFVFSRVTQTHKTLII